LSRIAWGKYRRVERPESAIDPAQQLVSVI